MNTINSHKNTFEVRKKQKQNEKSSKRFSANKVYTTKIKGCQNPSKRNLDENTKNFDGNINKLAFSKRKQKNNSCQTSGSKNIKVN